MSAFVSENTQFLGTDGKPLTGGKIYIGDQNLDPVLNPTDIFSNRALTIAIANPQPLDSLGKPTNKIWIGVDKYSIRIDNSADVQQFQELDNGEDTQVGTTKLDNVQGVDNVTATASTTITEYVDLQQYVFGAVGTNTQTMTLDIDNVGPKNIDDTATAGTFVLNDVISVYFSAATDSFQLGINPFDPASPVPIGSTTPNVITATVLKADTSLELATGATVTGIQTTLTSSATEIATSSAILNNIASQAQMEADTSLTTFVPPGRVKNAPGVSKAWALYNQVTPAISASYNVSSITDNGLGDFTVNFTTAFSSANYAGTYGTGVVTNPGIVLKENSSNVTRTTSAIRLENEDQGGTRFDATRLSAVFLGDQ